MVNLGTLLEGHGHAGEAEEWCRNAADAGDTDAMSKLGILLKEQGKDDEGEEWHHKGGLESSDA
jgi:uncharacterized protein